MKHNPGIGATPDLSLRISVATLTRVVFKHPLNDEWMLALERKAILREDKVEEKSQPLGGAIRILDINAILNLIGDFNFDSEHSRAEQDFRIFMRPTSWTLLREFCLEHLGRVNDPILETDPGRELIEEFDDMLKISLQPNQYNYKPVGIVVENEPAPTDNIHARGIPTVRVFRIFEAVITDAALIDIILKKSEGISLASNGNSKANTILALSLKRIRDHYLALSPEERNTATLFEKSKLDETTSAILDEIPVPKYQRLNEIKNS